jgi:hypothetical protein
MPDIRPRLATAAAPDAADPAQPAETTTAPRGGMGPRPKTDWVRSGAGYSATIDGRAYRVTKYPPDASINAPYGAYAEGRFIGAGLTLENVKGRCNAHAARLRFRSPGAPSPDPADDPAG